MSDNSNGPYVIKCLQENIELLEDNFGVSKTENIPMVNLSKALIGMYEDIEAEFRNLNTRLTRIEQILQRLK